MKKEKESTASFKGIFEKLNEDLKEQNKIREKIEDKNKSIDIEYFKKKQNLLSNEEKIKQKFAKKFDFAVGEEIARKSQGDYEGVVKYRKKQKEAEKEREEKSTKLTQKEQKELEEYIRNKEKLDKELKKIKKREGMMKLGAIQKKAEAISSTAERTFSKILGKTSVKVPKYSAVNLIKQAGRQSAPLVRQIEPREVEKDNRSLFFKEEFKSENNSRRNWLFD